MRVFQNKVIVITGGTGSLGRVLVRRLLALKSGQPSKIIVFSRDEAKQHYMRLEFQQNMNATDETIYRNFEQLLEFRIGDIRDYYSVSSVVEGADIIINAAALKQVPSCEYFPGEAVKTNIVGAENIVRAVRESRRRVDTVVGVSTDKACKPVNVMGMTKAIQERVFISANITAPKTRSLCVRYGNVLASRGSVIPLFREQIRHGGPVTVTSGEMTRFLLPLEQAVDIIFSAIQIGRPGEIFVPKISSARITDIIKAIAGDRPVETVVCGIRPGEKVHEILVSEEEARRTFLRGESYVIQPMLPELRKLKTDMRPLGIEYSSGECLMSLEETVNLLKTFNLIDGTEAEDGKELLR